MRNGNFPLTTVDTVIDFFACQNLKNMTMFINNQFTEGWIIVLHEDGFPIIVTQVNRNDTAVNIDEIEELEVKDRPYKGKFVS